MGMILSLASGKGGVGKSVLSANLAWLLAETGKRVVLADLDLGGTNLHTVLGFKNTNPGIGAFIDNKDAHLSDLLIPTGNSLLQFLPGDGLLPGAANLPFLRKLRILKELASLDTDIVVMDLGAGSSYNTVDLFLGGHAGFVVTTPEPTALLNAYGFIKTCLFRLLSGSVPAKHPLRADVRKHFCSTSGDGHENEDHAGISKFLDYAATIDPQKAAVMKARAQAFSPRIVINAGKELEEIKLGAKLRKSCTNNLGVNIEYLAYLPWDDGVRASIIARKLLCQTSPEAPFTKAVRNLAERVITSDLTKPAQPYGAFEDLQELANAFEG